jgi:putative phosphoserine phosphatase/1-acylglycerol-3-phosphate O-acyltransferase
MRRAVLALRLAASAAILTLGALVMLAAAIPTLFLARRFYSEIIGRAIGIAILRVWGVHYRVHRVEAEPGGQLVYISNHTSTIDVFLLIAPGLRRARFFLSGFLRKVVPLGIIGYLIRIFWTVPQEFPEERRRIFARAARVLRRTGDSVYLSPEGMRVTTGEIGPFNKGAFHLATSLRAPIVPIYFGIPAAINPGRGYDAKPGTIDVWFLPTIDTSEWRVEDVERNRDAVRDLFLRAHDAVRLHGSPAGALRTSVPEPAYAEASR